MAGLQSTVTCGHVGFNDAVRQVAVAALAGLGVSDGTNAVYINWSLAKSRTYFSLFVMIDHLEHVRSAAHHAARACARTAPPVAARGRSHSAEPALAFDISTIRPLIDARSVAGRGNGRRSLAAPICPPSHLMYMPRRSRPTIEAAVAGKPM